MGHTSFYRDKVGLLQLVSGYRVGAILGNVLEDEPPLVDVAGLGRHHRVLRRLARDGAEEGHGGGGSSEDEDEMLLAAKKLADKLRAKRAYTNTATFDLRCQVRLYV